MVKISCSYRWEMWSSSHLCG